MIEESGFGRLRQGNVDVVRDYGVVIAFVVLFAALSLSSSVFFTWANMKNLAFQTAPVGIIAAGGTLVFIAGGFDLSVGAVSGFAAIIAGKIFLGTGIGLWGSLILGALVGLGCGIGNGLLVTLGRVNAFMATLATSIIIYGFAQVVTSGNLVSVQTRALLGPRARQRLGDQLPDLRLDRVRARVRLPALTDDLRPLRVRGRRQRGGCAPLRRPCERRSAQRPSPSPVSPPGSPA